MAGVKDGNSNSGSWLVPENNTERHSSFTSAFQNLKKSEFYKNIEEQLPESADKDIGVNNSSAAGPSTTIRNTVTKSNALLVNPRQKGNPLLKSIYNVPWEFSEIIPDYVMGRTTCALFLSLRYHTLNPDYIHERLKLLGSQYELRVLLVQVDTLDPHHTLKYLTRMCILADLTLMLAWSPEEAGRIIETYKMFEHKPPDMIMEKQDRDPYQQISNALTSVRSVNRTDAATLLSTFGSLGKIIKASQDSLTLCPGLGPQKASRLYKVLHQPFQKDRVKKLKK
ncbi:DNA excision repair protein ERCC-1 [Schistocerca gregaria]|uniref:DNA excision repair protein ERCC-1 n=1 Tax=Schistocerca gregaria TaxID=7010 RepID=UPI00211E1FC2|nr:DNA excision repair protein ERCC-1 [Schistocerca gregaria]